MDGVVSKILEDTVNEDNLCFIADVSGVPLLHLPLWSSLQ